MTEVRVSINSTSEEVRSYGSRSFARPARLLRFPLIQLPRKSEVLTPLWSSISVTALFPLIQLPRKSEVSGLVGFGMASFLVSINSTSEEVRSGSLEFSLVMRSWGFH